MKNIIKNGCLLAIMVLLSCTCARAQHDSINYTDAKGLKQGKWVESYTINHVKYKDIGCYKDGLKDSVWNSYHPNGNLWQSSYFKKGLRDGVCHYFDKDGTIRSIQVYNDDTLKWSMWFNMHGCPDDEKNTVNNEIIHYNNGKWAVPAPTPDTIAPNFTDAKGRKRGSCVINDTVNNKMYMTIGYYKDNLRDSVYDSYYFNGNLYARSYFKGGLLDGICHGFWEDGTILAIVVYKDDNPVWSMTFDRKGCPFVEENEVNEERILYNEGKWFKFSTSLEKK